MLFHRKPSAALSGQVQAEYAYLIARSEVASRSLRSVAAELTPADRSALLEWAALRRYRRRTLRAMISVIALGGISVALSILANQPPQASIADLVAGPGAGIALFGLLSVTMTTFDSLIDRTPARDLRFLYWIAAAALTLAAGALWASDSLTHAAAYKMFVDVVIVSTSAIAVLMSLVFSHGYAMASRQFIIPGRAVEFTDAQAHTTKTPLYLEAPLTEKKESH
ncbi:hypothetical protein [Nocardia yamanashiensis]|uniref:hypothetical protein n=1 Tax=Nocardia yamanashiensis TaxID=209247 RepID=UPI00083700AC|nr:hypothetical protein [Nocardia yamanashiensis]